MLRGQSRLYSTLARSLGPCIHSDGLALSTTSARAREKLRQSAGTAASLPGSVPFEEPVPPVTFVSAHVEMVDRGRGAAETALMWVCAGLVEGQGPLSLYGAYGGGACRSVHTSAMCREP